LSYTGLVFIAYLTLFVLIMNARLLLKWIGIGIATLILTAPILPRFLTNGPARIEGAMPQPPLPFFQAMLKVCQDFGGSAWFLPLLGAAALSLLWLAVRHAEERRRIFLLIVWILLPVAAYFAISNQEFLKPRYQWSLTVGLAVFIGYAALRIPKIAQWAAIAAFVVLPVVPVNFFIYRLAETTSPPFRATFAWFKDNIRPGDVLIIDPYCTCGEPAGWDYFVTQYFPTGYLPIVDHPGTNSRVWYLSTTGWQRDEALLAEIEKGRTPTIFYGPWYFLLRLYEGPPDWQGVKFADELTLNGAEIDDNDVVMAKDEQFSVKLWWSAQQKLDRDYSVSVAVLNHEGQLVAQVDGPPAAPPAAPDGTPTPSQTSTWQPGTYYTDIRAFHLPSNLADGDYLLVATVYQWWDGVRLIPEDNSRWERTGQDKTYVVLKHIKVVS
ncbi:MAG TPA: hypothetical protein VMT34_16060, partial [Aggregatilineales bacterium]|nr:hypothetical protein [Aggregatilineales bacterium]